MNTIILIPARLESTRFPEKMLADLNGKTLIRTVWEKCQSFGYPSYVVSDSRTVLNQSPLNLKTQPAENGTERISIASDSSQVTATKIINVQGDMPDITLDIIKAVEKKLDDYSVSTAYTKMSKENQQDPNSVKMIHNGDTAHWFCRAPLEYGDHHLGVYGYRLEQIATYRNLKKYKEEEKEQLEQLRWIQNDVTIGVTEVEFDGIEINTPQDLERWKQNNG